MKKHSKETKKKMSESRKKYIKKHGIWNKGMTWEEMYGEKKAKEMRERVKKKGKRHFNYGRKRPDLTERNLKNNPMKKIKTQEKSSKSHKKSGQWIGRTKARRYLKGVWYCWKCGSKKNIQVHHIDKDRTNNKLDNLMILCAKCHMKLHKSKVKK